MFSGCYTGLVSAEGIEDVVLHFHKKSSILLLNRSGMRSKNDKEVCREVNNYKSKLFLASLGSHQCTKSV